MKECTPGWDTRCPKAKCPKCTCKCDGDNHGKENKQATDDRAVDD